MQKTVKIEGDFGMGALATLLDQMDWRQDYNHTVFVDREIYYRLMRDMNHSMSYVAQQTTSIEQFEPFHLYGYQVKLIINHHKYADQYVKVISTEKGDNDIFTIDFPQFGDRMVFDSYSQESMSLTMRNEDVVVNRTVYHRAYPVDINATTTIKDVMAKHLSPPDIDFKLVQDSVTSNHYIYVSEEDLYAYIYVCRGKSFQDATNDCLQLAKERINAKINKICRTY